MAKRAPSREVTAFVKKVRAELDPEKIILFGSRAKGDYWKRSDYDFIIVSSAFEGMHWLHRISKVVGLWDSLSDIDALPYTPREFKEKSKTSSVVKNAVKHGVLITG